MDNTPVIGLVGNANAGKSTLFNALTGMHQHVGNWPGVTVEVREGRVSFGRQRTKLIDFPGTYSLRSLSSDEAVVKRFVLDRNLSGIINIIDACNLERSLYLTSQLVELGIPVIVVLNMSDLAERAGVTVDDQRLSELMGAPVVPMVASKGTGMDDLRRHIQNTLDQPSSHTPRTIIYDEATEKCLGSIAREFAQNGISTNGYSSRWAGLGLLLGDPEITGHIGGQEHGPAILDTVRDCRDKLESASSADVTDMISEQRLAAIRGVCAEAITFDAKKHRHFTDAVDHIVIHPFWGLLVFGALMWLMFNMVFALGDVPVQWCRRGIEMLAELCRSSLSPGMLRSVIVDGVIAGVGNVIVFLPNLMLLFLSIAILEDTGYMSRAAFVMDRIMHRIGLHGKSIIPMLIGLGCTVPAYMSARIVENRADRIVTMHATSFMSCSGRLPVYILVAGAFWPDQAGNVVFGIYVLGALMAVLTIKLLKSTRFKGRSSPFILELPPYKTPTLSVLLQHMWERSFAFIRNAGTVIFVFSILMWFLMNFPGPATSESQGGEATRIEETTELIGAPANNQDLHSADLRTSFAGRIGTAIEPVISPLGLDWRMGIAIVSGLAGKELVVSTMGAVYGASDTDRGAVSLQDKLAGDPRYSGLVALSFIIFILLYSPCTAALAVLFRETGSIKEVIFQLVYTTGLAWTVSFVTFQAGRLLGLD